MRHGISGNRLSRNQTLRKATMRDMARAILVRERIFTTKAKAKEARKFIDRLITLGKKGTLADKRRAFAILCDHQLVSNLFNTTAPRFNNRAGGYTRIIPFGNRRGDNAQMVYLELTEKSKSVASAGRLRSAAIALSSVTAEAQDVTKVSDAQTSESSEPAKEAPKKSGGLKKIFKKKTDS